MYFKHFPFLEYPTQDKQTELARDITIRLGFSTTAKDTNDIFNEYIVEEGMTPEKIAEEVYGDPRYFWIVLLFNEIQDPQYNFSLRTKSFDEFCERKYRSKTLFISPVGISQEFYSHYLGATSDVRNFSEGDTITLYVSKNNYKDSEEGNKVLGVIKRFIPEISAIQLDSLEGNIVRGDIIARGYDGEIRAEVRKVVDSRYSLHHFESDGFRLNPLATPPDGDGTQVPLGQTGSGFLNLVGTTQTILENYVNDDNTTYVVTNDDYEFRANDEYRTIKLLDPRYLENINRELREVLKK